jgi:hypothetical protein
VLDWNIIFFSVEPKHELYFIKLGKLNKCGFHYTVYLKIGCGIPQADISYIVKEQKVLLRTCTVRSESSCALRLRDVDLCKGGCYARGPH